MRVLVICNDRWHPAQTVRLGLESLGECGFEFDFQENAIHWSAEKMKQYQLIIFAKSDNISEIDVEPWVTAEVQQAFVHFVETGGGLVAIHSGTCYLENPVLRSLMGGAFTTHPEQCPVAVIPKEEHPIAAGCSPFTITDEHYFMEFDPQGAELFLITRSEHCEMPGGWTRIQGNGRVCVLTPGHNVEVWRHPTYQKLLINALRWGGKLI